MTLENYKPRQSNHRVESKLTRAVIFVAQNISIVTDFASKSRPAVVDFDWFCLTRASIRLMDVSPGVNLTHLDDGIDSWSSQH